MHWAHTKKCIQKPLYISKYARVNVQKGECISSCMFARTRLIYKSTYKAKDAIGGVRWMHNAIVSHIQVALYMRDTKGQIQGKDALATYKWNMQGTMYAAKIQRRMYVRHTLGMYKAHIQRGQHAFAIVKGLCMCVMQKKYTFTTCKGGTFKGQCISEQWLVYMQLYVCT